MTPRAAPVVAVLSWALAISSLVLLAVSEASGVEGNLFHYQDAAVGLAFPALGWLVLRRLGSHPVGWILMAAGLSGSLGAFGEEYVTVGHELYPGFLPAVAAVAWIGSWTWAFFVGLLPILLLVFPDGKLLSPRWRPVLWLAFLPPILAPLLLAVVTWDAPIEVLAGSEEPDFPGALGGVFEAGIVVLGVSLLAALISLAIRWRRGRGATRQQMKLFFLFAAAGVLCLILSQIETPIRDVLGVAAFLLVPAGMVAAILRYRLYDIDRLVSRTVAYGLLSAILITSYFGLVFVFRGLLPFSGDLPVAVSTLAVAAAFAPLRQWIQATVDRRFNRSRYDVERVASRFARALRTDTTVPDLQEGLQTVVATTLEPSHVSLWLPEETQ